MFRQKLFIACNYLKLVFVNFAPKDTWNLALNAIRLVQINDLSYQIIIGGEIANYAIYTNEPWVDDRFNGHRNPNEGWVEKAIAYATPGIKNIMDGTITVKELVEINQIQKNQIDIQRENAISRLEGGN